MALTRCLPVLLLAAMTATTGASDARASFYVTKCYPAPALAVDGGSEFRGNLLHLLGSLPSAAAQTGFASLQTAGRTASDRALVRGLCFGYSAAEPCRRCLSDAGQKIADTELCGEDSRRARLWHDRCFLGYTDGANSSSAGADDDFIAVSFSGDAVPSPDIVSVQRLVALVQSLAPRVADGSVATADAITPASKGDATAGNRTVRVLAQCARDRCAADCARCLREASLAMAKSWGAGSDARGRVAAVLGSNCYLRFEISTPPLPLREKIWRMIEDNLVVTVCAAVLKDIAAVLDLEIPPPPPTLGEKIWIVCVFCMKGFVLGMVVGVPISLIIVALIDVYHRMRMRMKARNNRNAAAAPAVEAMSGIMTMK